VHYPGDTHIESLEEAKAMKKRIISCL